MTGTRMSDDRKTEDQPTFVIATAVQPSEQPSSKSRLTKKHVLIGVVSLLITGLVVTAVLVAIRIYTDNELEEMKLQYSMSMKDKNNNDVKQNVSSDTNSVLYEVARDGMKTWILQDFDKGVEVMKVESDSGVACYLSALNRSAAREPSKLPKTAANPDDKTPSTQLVYKVSETPVKDISFLGSRASKLCNNIPTYWSVQNCDKDKGTPNGQMNATNTTSLDRDKRATTCNYCYGYSCVCGCCGRVCGSFASLTYTYYYNYWTGFYVCVYQMWYVSCNQALNAYPYYGCYYGFTYYYYPWS